MHRSNKAFSLVELSIVLVILGLLTGGILAGQNLIHAAELRNLTATLKQYHAAVYTFRDKYFALPGDMSNATKFWGVQNASPATCKTTASTSALTCDGDGDGEIKWGATGSNEPYRAWQHLANAGLVEGNYPGIADVAGTNLATPGYNVPRTKIAQGGVTLVSLNDYTSDSGSFFQGTYGNLFSVGAAYTDHETRVGFITPEDAWNIDTKLDDGMPQYGKIRGRRSATCTTTMSNADAEYALTLSDKGCAFRYLLE